MASITLRSTNAVALSSSPFTYAQKVYAYPGQRWSASVTIPPVRRDTAEPWIAFLTALRGQYGTFLMGDPNATAPQGAASGTLLVNGASQTGGSIDCDGAVQISDLENYAFGSDFAAGSDIPWDFEGLPQYVVQTTVEGANGTIGRLRITSSAAISYAQLRRKVSVEPGDVIYMSLWAYRDADYNGTSGNSKLRLANGATGALLSALPYGTGDLPVSTWTKLETSYTVPSGVSQIQFSLGRDNTAGILLIDEIEIKKKSPIFKAGDYVQLGATAATRTLHKLLQDVIPDDSGNFTMEIWPHVRTSPANNATITYTNTVGRWRLASNETEWSIDAATKYGISFDCVEAI